MKNTAHQPMKRKLLALLAGLPLFTACVPAEVRAARKAGEEREKAYHDSLTPKERAALQRFRGIGIQLVVDAAAGAEMEGVKIHSDNGYSIFSSGRVSQGKSISDVGSARVPLWVRVIWREKPKAIWGKDGGIDWDGPIIGDYTIPVAERIPDEVLESLRKDPRGSLRIKFRLHPRGVYFGWDLERRPGFDPNKRAEYRKNNIYFPPGYEMTGGDFKEARVASYLWTEEKGFVPIHDLPMILSKEDIAYLDKQSLFPVGTRVWEKGWYIDKSGKKIEYEGSGSSRASTSYPVTALMLAAGDGTPEDVKSQLARGIDDINAKNVNGATALMYAALAGRSDNVKVLLEAGARIDDQDDKGNTALSFARQQGHQEVAQLLIAAGAKPLPSSADE